MPQTRYKHAISFSDDVEKISHVCIYSQMAPIDVWIPDPDQAKAIAKFAVYLGIVMNTTLVILACVAFFKHPDAHARWRLTMAIIAFSLVFYAESMQIYILDRYEVYSYIVIVGMLLGTFAALSAHGLFGTMVVKHIRHRH